MIYYEIQRAWDHIVGAPCYQIYQHSGIGLAVRDIPCQICGLALRVEKCGAECTAKTAKDKRA